MRVDRRRYMMDLLDKYGVVYEVLEGGAHLVIRDTPVGIIDFFPIPERFRPRNKSDRNRNGVYLLLTACGVGPEKRRAMCLEKLDAHGIKYTVRGDGVQLSIDGGEDIGVVEFWPGNERYRPRRKVHPPGMGVFNLLRLLGYE